MAPITSRRDRRSRRRAVWWLTAASLVWIASPFRVQAQSTFTGLGDLPGGGFASGAQGVSADGSVVVGYGKSSDGPSDREAFRWTAAGGMQGLGDLAGGSLYSEANGVSADGSVIVGRGASASGGEAFRWTAGGGMQGLGYLPGGRGNSGATAVSADGAVVVGLSNTAAGNTEAFYWTAISGMVSLGDFTSGGFPGSTANGISADGSTIVGGMATSNGPAGPFRWTPQGGLEVLSDRGGEAKAISADGAVVVGWFPSDTAAFEAFRWTAAEGLVGLGGFPGRLDLGLAYGVSADGSVIVGAAEYSGEFGATQGAFVWDAAHGMHRIRELLERAGAPVAGWELTVARAVSADGRTIVGEGINPSGQPEAWMAVLVRECEDRIDNDGDGLVDFPQDPGCSGPEATTESPQCDDGVDNDADGLVDHPADPGCSARSSDAESPPCSDGVDNDGDGLLDHPLDPECKAASGPTEAQCDDGIDSDGDGFVDLDDAGCREPNDATERADCSDGIDDDADELVDFPADPGCAGPGSATENPQCDDGVDDDADGRIDLDDPQCTSASHPSERPAWFMSLGDLSGGGVNSEATAVSGDGRVVVGSGTTASGGDGFRWTAETGMVSVATLTGSDEPGIAVADVSADGSVLVGTHTPSTGVGGAFRWTAESGLVDLGALPDLGWRDSAAVAVSADGSVVVGYVGPSIFRWTISDGMIPLFSVLGGPAEFVSDVSGDGLVLVGTLVDFFYGTSRAFWWNAATGTGNVFDESGTTTAVNHDGSVVVGIDFPQGEPFRWAHDRMVGLGGQGAARDVSADGSVVVGDGAFVWDPIHGKRSLRDVLVHDYGLDLTGWRTLGSALGISANGRTIVGVGTNPRGQNEAWMASLPPYWDCSDGLDNDGDGYADLDDPACPAASFSPENPQCEDGLDNDGDGLVDGDDPGCLAAFVPREDPPCDDEIDNDGDGAVDAEDTGCPYWEEPPCGLGVELWGVIPMLAWLRRARRRRTAQGEAVDL